MIDVNERLNRPKSVEPSSGQHFNTMGPPRNFLDIVYKTTMLLKKCTNGFNPLPIMQSTQAYRTSLLIQ